MFCQLRFIELGVNTECAADLREQGGMLPLIAAKMGYKRDGHQI